MLYSANSCVAPVDLRTRSWLEKNRDKVNVIDVSSAGGLDNILRLLADHLKDPDLLKARSFRA
jgi:hypothetical protein